MGCPRSRGGDIEAPESSGGSLGLDVAMDVDAISLVLGAIAASVSAGAGDAIRDTTKGAITGTRDRLLELVRRRLKKDAVGVAKLTVYTAEPTPTNGQALQGHLIDAGVDEDQDILTLAREVLSAAGPAAIAPGSVGANVINQINKDGGTGYIGGQHVHHHGTAPTAHVAWEVFRLEGNGYELRNTGTTTAHNVTITANVNLSWPTPPDQDIPGGSSAMFIYGRRAVDPSPVLTVIYTTTASGPNQQRWQRWQRPLPR